MKRTVCITAQYSWFFSFDEKPNSKEITDSLKVASNFLIESTIQDQTRETTKHAVKLLPSFSLSCDIGKVFTKWLTGSGGGYKKDRAAQQIVTRCFKFLRFCCEDEEELTFDVVDFGLCSPNLLLKFIDYLQDECKLGHGGRLGYIDAISEMIDFRKLHGTSEAVFQKFSATELYLKRVRKTVAKMMRLQWTQDLDIETLEARGHWATMEELLEVVKFHLPRYENTLKICKSSPAQVNPSDLTFATKFVAMYLTVNMIATAKEKGKFIDQKTFKTAGKYGFDSLILTDADIQVLNGYISYVRPLLKPQCDFVLVNRNGGQHGKLGEIMSKLVFDAIGKYIHPTRYRQIVETQSLNELTSVEQRILSEDQKHSSAVAKVHYQKKRSREVALKGHKCLQKLQGAKGSEVDEDVHARLGESTSEAGPSVERVQNISSSPKKDALPKRILRSQTNIRRVLKFTTEEDEFLKKGITKHGFGQWTAILRDDDFQFQDGRTADSLKKRAGMKMPQA